MISILYKTRLLLLFIALFSCTKNQDNIPEETAFKIDYEKITLDNGLTVIFHLDQSDPVVAVNLTCHVGSAREINGRTGFAHLFEHLLFLESENLGKGGLDKMSALIGGSGANGSTNRDRTNYYQTVPKDALEKMIWAEADKLGYFINTVTDPVLAKEKQVVKNEKRQSVDNRPYGHTLYVIDKNLYPENHPYNWQVIGSLEDLQNATLQDVKNFYNRWYVPNNVVLTISGDFDIEQAKTWVKKYFEEIPKGDAIPKIEKQQINLTETKKLYYEDNFARAPQLSLAWPSVHQYHPDSYALEVLSVFLSDGKTAPLYTVLVEDNKLTDNLRAFQYSSELAGQFMIQVTAFNDTKLENIWSSINEGFTKFETEGISEANLNRIKAGQETRFYNRLSSVLGKGFQLTQYEIFANDAGYITKDIENILKVTPEDVMRVYNTYIKNKHYVATSFVPKGQVDLALADSKLAEVVEEEIIEGAEEVFDSNISAEYEKTPSSFDRSVEPSFGESPNLKIPDVWQAKLGSGISLYGIQINEVPLVQFEIQLKGGLLFEQQDRIGVSNLLASLMTKGTAKKTPEELENAINTLGASINAFATNEAIVITGNTLAKNYGKTIDLIEEIILHPRWDEKEFELIRQSTLAQIERQKAQPSSIADNEFNKLVYGKNHILSHNVLGTQVSVDAITINDLKLYYKAFISPALTTINTAGAISENQVIKTLSSLNDNWEANSVQLPSIENVPAPTASKIYFYDVPGAKQSVLHFGYPALAATDPDYYLASILNYRLGGGGFASELTQRLREDKGYTYGIQSGFSGSAQIGTFEISSSVRSNVTYESTLLIKEIIDTYAKNFNESDLEITKNYLTKSNARAFETLQDKLGMLTAISNYGYEKDYIKTREQILGNISINDLQILAKTYLNSDKMIYLIVGDAKTQLDKLNGLGFGKPIILNP